MSHRFRVLVVDDDRQILRSFRLCLEDAGYSVATALDFVSAEQKLAESVFSLCFLDLRLGEDSALDLLPRLRQLAPWMRVVVVTGESSIASAVAAIKSGASDFLVKPCPPEVLLGTAASRPRPGRWKRVGCWKPTTTTRRRWPNPAAAHPDAAPAEDGAPGGRYRCLGPDPG